MRRKYKFKTKPYRHQVAALKKLKEINKKLGGFGALLMAPRTGKTKVAIDWVAMLHQAGKVNRVLVICPIGVIGVWEEELAAHCPFPYRITIWDKKGRKRKPLPRWGKDIIDFVIVNYDGFSTPGAPISRGKRSRSRGGRWTLRKQIRRWQPQMIILDESHRIKSPRSRKASMIWSLGPETAYRLIMTGTAVTKKKRVFDLYSQWKFLNPSSPLINTPDGEMTLGDFKRIYSVWTERNGYPQWLRNRENKIKILRRYLHAESFAVTRDECFDLPKRTDQKIPVDLTDHTAEVYDQMAEDMVAKIKTGEITEASIRLVLSLRLAQITSGLAKTTPSKQHSEGRLVRIGRDKLEVMESLISDLFEADEKIVVPARWRADIAAVAKMCDRLKVKRFIVRGGVDRTQRDLSRRQFNQMDGPACFIMQPAASSLGIDLSSASIMIWFSLTNSWVDFTQAEDRIALSPNKTTFMYLLARGTIDYLMYDSLQEDGDLARAVQESPDRLLRNFKQ